ncbi:MAG: hypothetical protein ACLQBJ_07725 [Bryobacteraceae bacterium]
MVSFRKLILVMALVVMVTGIALAAGPSAPIVTCNTFNQQTARFQQENQTALLPNLTFVCQVANQLPNILESGIIQEGTIYDWEVFFPVVTPLTVSTYNAGKTEPQLFVDVVTYGGTDEGTSSPYYALGPTPGGIFPGNGTSGGEVTFARVNMNPDGDEDPSDAPDSVYITITNLRASMLGIASNPPNYGGPMTVTVWAKPSQTKIGANQSNPGNVFLPTVNGVQQPTIAVGLGYAAPSLAVTETDYFDWRQCFSWGQQGDSWDQYFHVDFAELYSYAFAPPVDGWETPSLGTADVSASQLPLYPTIVTGQGGTRLVFIFSSGGDDGWPAFVTLGVPSAIEVYDGYSTVYARAVLVNNPDSNGNGGTLATWDNSSWFPDTELYGDGVAGAWSALPWVTISPLGTPPMVVYEILPGASPAVTMTLEVPVGGYLNATPSIYPPPDDPSAEVTIINAGYAPWTPGPVPQLTPIPRFISPPPFNGSNLLYIDPCTTNLLYPYLVSGQSWDTGVAVANTGMDPFVGDGPFGGRGYAAGGSNPNVYGISGVYNEQPGVCWFYFYGSFNNARGVYAPASSPVILGGAAGFASSGGSTPGADPEDYIVPGTTGEDLISVALLQLWPTWNPTKVQWNGYAIAMCDFLYAHGYGFSDFHGTAAQGGNYSLGYLALVFDQRGIEHNSQAPEKMTF